MNTLSNIKDQRKRFQKAPTPPRGRIKQNREYHNQSRSTPPGEQAPPIIHLQTKFPHKKTKVTKKIHREREKHSTRFRKRGRTIPMHSQNRMNFSHGGRHKSRMQFQNQPETMNSAFPKHRRPFNSSHQLSNKQLLRGISLMRSRFNTTQFYNQKIHFRAGEGEIYPKQGLRQESSTTPRSTTLWSQWLPPHSVLDEYYDSDEGKKATKRDKKATDSREKHGWVGWDGGDFMHFYHPNDPKYGLDPKVPIPR